MKNHRIVNIIDNSSSEEDLQKGSVNMQMHRKKSRKRRKNNNNLPLTRLAYEIVEAICDGGEDDGSSDDADDADDGDGECDLLNDSDECSDPGQVPSAVLKHLQGEGPYIRAIAETHISELLSGAENEGSYSSPMSNKSENLDGFDVEDMCDDAIAQLVNAHNQRGVHNTPEMNSFVSQRVQQTSQEIASLVNAHNQRVAQNTMPPAFAAAAAAMAAAHTAMSMQKTEANVAAAAAALAAAAVATDNAQQTLLDYQGRASAMAAQAKVQQTLLDIQERANTMAAKALAAGIISGHVKHNSEGEIVDIGNVATTNKESNKNTNTSTSPQQPTFKINDVCQPGNTLLWDLLQDDKIVSL